MRRWIIAVHRWLGAALSIFALMWFATGIVLIYAPLPAFSPERQLRGMEPLDCSRCRGSLRDALLAMSGRDTTAPVRLGMLLGRPVWRYLGDDERWHALAADGGASLGTISSAEAVRIADADARLGGAPVADSATISKPDQWTLEGVLRHQLPLHRIDFGDDAGTRSWVSAYAGDVILTTTRRERALAWVGAIPHFLYPRVLRVRLGAWLEVVIVLAGLGALMSLSGLIVGVWLLRLRGRSRAAEGRMPMSPYRTGWMRWHHYLGLIFGVFTFTWMLSGMLSVDPFDWSPGDEPSTSEALAFAGGALDGARFHLAPGDAARLLGDGAALRELRPIMVAGHPYWLGFDSASATRVVRADIEKPTIAEAIARSVIDSALVPIIRSPVVEIAELRAPDDYYFATSTYHRTFPVLRIRLADRDRTAFYIDPRRGEIAMKQVTRSRAERWLYTGLHDLEFRALSTRRPLWDIAIIALLLGGISLSVTSIVGAWRWLAPKAGIRTAPRR